MLGTESHYMILKNIQFVHLDDLCETHIFLFETPEAKGWYICSSHDSTIYDLARMLKNRYPEYNIPQEFVLFSLTWFQLFDWFFNYQSKIIITISFFVHHQLLLDLTVRCWFLFILPQFFKGKTSNKIKFSSTNHVKL